MDIAKLMKQAQQLQSGLESAKQKLAEEQLTVEAVGGKIQVTTTCAGDIVGLRLDPSIVDAEDVEFLQEMILKALQEAQQQAKAKSASEMKKLTGGMGLPPGLI